MKLPRQLYAATGWVMLALGAIGLFLPLLPTTPFVLAAAGLFSRASPRTADWLEQHPLFGRSLANWRRRGEIDVSAKLLAISSMVVGFGLTVHVGKIGNLVGGILATILLVAALFILTRPRPISHKGSEDVDEVSKPDS